MQSFRVLKNPLAHINKHFLSKLKSTNVDEKYFNIEFSILFTAKNKVCFEQGRN